MQAWFAVAAGGVVGAVLRYGVVILATKIAGTGFPFGTLIVNVVGSFAMGFLVEAMALSWSVSQELRLFLAVGLLGSFTTFSTFSLDVYSLYERQAYVALTTYATGSFALSLLGLIFGLALARRLIIA
jgi:CrcB protein